jgi:hypothetical protein
MKITLPAAMNDDHVVSAVHKKYVKTLLLSKGEKSTLKFKREKYCIMAPGHICHKH